MKLSDTMFCEMLDCHQLKSIHVVLSFGPSTLSHTVLTLLYAISCAFATIFFILIGFVSLPQSHIHSKDISSIEYST